MSAHPEIQPRFNATLEESQKPILAGFFLVRREQLTNLIARRVF